MDGAMDLTSGNIGLSVSYGIFLIEREGDSCKSSQVMYKIAQSVQY